MITCTILGRRDESKEGPQGFEESQTSFFDVFFLLFVYSKSYGLKHRGPKGIKRVVLSNRRGRFAGVIRWLPMAVGGQYEMRNSVCPFTSTFHGNHIFAYRCDDLATELSRFTSGIWYLRIS